VFLKEKRAPSPRFEQPEFCSLPSLRKSFFGFYCVEQTGLSVPPNQGDSKEGIERCKHFPKVGLEALLTPENCVVCAAD